MLEAIDRVSLAATIHLLLAGLLLVGVGVAGLGGSPWLVLVFLGVTAVLFAARDRLPAAGRVARVDTDRLVADVWIATALAATTTVLALDATPDELTALGGILGLVAMANYFLRPVYYVVLSLVESVVESARAGNG